MPYSMLIPLTPTTDAPVAQIHGPAIQAMVLQRIQQVDPGLAAQLHDAPGSRPFTLSPLGTVDYEHRFQVFHLSRQQSVAAGTTCYLRVTLLADELFPVLRQVFFEPPGLTVLLGTNEFALTTGQEFWENEPSWVSSRSYPELIDRALQHQRRRKFSLKFITPTSFSQGDLDLPLPLPRLVFHSYKKRFEQFYQVVFLPDFEALVERFVGVASLKHIRTEMMQTKKVPLIGFVGDVVFVLLPQTPPELIFQINLLAEFATFCGTGKKTVLGMGQTALF